MEVTSRPAPACPPLVNSANIQEIKEGDLSVAEHEALQRTLSIKTGEERGLSLRGSVFICPCVRAPCTHTHPPQDREHRNAYRTFSHFSFISPPVPVALGDAYLFWFPTLWSYTPRPAVQMGVSLPDLYVFLSLK